MFARISTQFDCTESELWQEISKPASLQFVASPLLSFTPAEPGMLDGEWEVGLDYALKLYFLNVIPMGHHCIQFVQIDRERNIISTRESGLLARVWNHDITFKETKPGLVSYADDIDIRAGLLTPFVWLFAHVFYRHRQRRWRRLLLFSKTRS